MHCDVKSLSSVVSGTKKIVFAANFRAVHTSNTLSLKRITKSSSATITFLRVPFLSSFRFAKRLFPANSWSQLLFKIIDF